MAPLLPSALWVLVLATATQARPASQWAVHETAIVPSDWKYVGQPEVDTTVTRVSISLQQPGLDELRRRLDQISDIDNADYGAHLSRGQLEAYQEPAAEAVHNVMDWLSEHGIEDRLAQKYWISFNATVGLVNSLLRCNLSEYETPRSQRVLRATEYSLPSELAQHIQFVYPLTQFLESSARRNFNDEGSMDVARASRRQASWPATCSENVTPDCLVDLYNITYTPPDSSSGSTIGVAGFLEEYPSQSSLRDFLVNHSPQRTGASYSPDYNFTVVSINGGNATNEGSGGEAFLDTFYTALFTQPLPISYLSTGGRGQYIGPNGTDLTNTSANGNEPWVEFLQYLLAAEDADLPKVLSVSYTDDEQAVSRPYALHVCDLFMQLAARGVSVIAASGDGGAAGTASSTNCVVNSGDPDEPPQFIPTFPASCPYVTSIGATGRFIPWQPASFSSGGFSNYFPAPSWQAKDTSAYIKALNGTRDGWFNASGRGIPDLTLVGSRFLLGGEGKYAFTTKGTSASTPVWASIITLINDKRLRAGKPVLGFLNPILYSNSVRAALVDVAEGSVGGCSLNNGQDFVTGWDAATGWDPTSGLGVPDFGALMEVLG
ncbi:hypothetical protein Daus18300_007758 [Diaporthe australafricana]|uniref:Peptidase S53 domain-containing protein n=1 Tax=Diaporthe australafricana TaxID=127596 RepID=A0ABR3WLC6_9PEZI